MNEDAELLGRYVTGHSESAFAELIRRHVDLVYSAASRMVYGDVHRAQDVTQQVFSELARQSGRLTRHPALTGWLYTTTRLMALRAVRTEQRRKAREQEATRMNRLLSEPALEPEWEQLGPVLEDAMHELNENDRLALLLRFFQNKALKDVGAALGLSENSARMRVERALEKLRVHLAQRGVTSTASALALTLAGKAVAAAPAGFVAALTAASIAGATAGTGGALTALKLMTITKLQIGIGVAAIIIVVVPLALQHQEHLRLMEENQRQAGQLAQLTAENQRLSNSLTQARRAAAPNLEPFVAMAPAPPDNAHPTNLVSRLRPLLTNGYIKLSAAQMESYLKEQKRSAGSLLAAFRASGDKALLVEAMEKYPNDPQVGYAAAFKDDATPEEKRQWLDTFKQSAPGNAIANYLSALDYFKTGQSAQAVQELSAAAGKGQFQDYSEEFVQNGEEVYAAAGYSPAEAEALATTQLLLPQLLQLKQLNQNIVDMAKSYSQAGDAVSAQALLQMDVQLGQRYNEAPGEAVVSTLVGIAIQKNALQSMDPDSPYGAAGQTVGDQINQLTQQRDALQTLSQQEAAIEPEMTDQDYISYKNRWLLFGEENALHWVVSKYGGK